MVAGAFPLMAMTGEPTDDELLAEAVDWRMRIDAAPEDGAVRAALDAWLARSAAHRRAYADVERLARVADALPADYENLQAADEAELSRPAPPARARSVRRAGYAAVALAACLAFLFLPSLQLWMAADYSTGTAELRTITLEDGSIVSLDAGSAVATQYSAARREVTLLSGRAFFEVVPAADRPFVVIAQDVTVTVTGTAFDVGRSGDAVSVAVQSGTVEVATARSKGNAVSLVRGERLTVDRKLDQMAKSEIAPGDVAAWRERRLIVDKATLAEVAEELGRHYAGVVVLPGRGLAERRVSGVFDLRQPVEALQAAVRTHGGSTTRITPYLVVVSGP
jgi:transmembrane sensor